MNLYHHVTLDPLALEGAPIALPALFAGLSRESLADLSWTAPDHDGAYVGRGLWPVVEIRPTPGAGERNSASPAYEIVAQEVRAIYAVEWLPLAEVKAERLAALAAWRYARETGGITINGAAIRTDRESQALVTGASALVAAAPETVVDWKGAAGWVQLDAAAVTAIALAVGTHVQACFSAERGHAAAIDACETAAAAAAYDFTGGWPE